MALPTGYKEVEYIESTGGQYIDTGLNSTNNLGWSIKMSYTDPKNNEINGGPKNKFGVIEQGLNCYDCVYGSNVRFSQQQFDTNVHIFKLDVSNRYFYVDDIVPAYGQGAFPVSSFDDGKNFILFGTENSKNVKARLYYAKFNNNGLLICDMIPCLDNNKRPCLYDNISGNTFYNSGSGEFLYKEFQPSKKFRLFYTVDGGNKKLRFLGSKE